MRLLLDTHALIWWTNDSRLLSRAAHHAIADRENFISVSAVSAFEIATKHRLGKLAEGGPLAADFDGETDREGFERLAITSRHARLGGVLDIQHRDPFDRLLIAQALAEDMIFISNEKIFDGFGVQRLW